MIDILWTVLYAGLLLLAIVIVYGAVIAVVIGIRAALDNARYKQMQAKHDQMLARHARNTWPSTTFYKGRKDDAS